MATKREKYIRQNTDLEIDARHLLHNGIPVYKYGAKGERKAGDEGILYHVNVQFASFDDLVEMAIGKVLHAVGHAIADGLINTDEQAVELGYTTVDSTGKPPVVKKVTIEDMKSTVEASADKEATAKAILDMLKASGIDPKVLAKLSK